MKIALVLDKSGSMSACHQATISAVNEYFDDLKNQKTEATVYITLFDTELTHMVDGVSMDRVPTLNTENYRPSGCTALLDAIGATIKRVEPIGNWVEPILVVIMTDGHENSSREFSHQDIQRLIKEKEDSGHKNWTFVFLSANLDAFDVGAAMGISAGNSAVMDTSKMDVTMKNLAGDTMAYAASGNSQTKNFTRGKKDYSDEEGKVSGGSSSA